MNEVNTSSKSTSKCEVVEVKLLPHPNADKLSLVKVCDYSVVVNTAQWSGLSKGVYIPPDSVVDSDRPEFSFLKKPTHTTNKVRIKACKLRGVISFGLLIPYSGSEPLGTDLAQKLDVSHYEPEIEVAMGGDNIKANLQLSKYDVDTLRKYRKCFVENEPILVLEKIHGANGRYTFHKTDGVLLVGSRTNWKAESDKSPWYIALKNHPEIKVFCEANPNLVLFGEVYGQVQDMKYGLKTCKFMSFDMWDKTQNRFLDFQDWLSTCAKYRIPTVPILGEMPFNFETLEKLSNGQSLVPGANHIREGIVIKPPTERYDDHLGRVIAKLVGADYLCT